MSLHRVILVAFATAFTVGMTSLASASCCGVSMGGCCGTPVVYAAPVVVAPPPMMVAPAPIAVAPAPIAVTTAVTPFGGPCCSANGCGNCLNWVPAAAGCGACGGWGGGGGGCDPCGGGWSMGRCGACGGSPLYVVNQGPVYSGPALTIPYQTYSPDTAYAAATDYPYVPGYGAPPVAGYPYAPGYAAAPAPMYPPLYHHLYVRPHYAYRAPMYVHRYPVYARGHRAYAPHAAPHWRHYP